MEREEEEEEEEEKVEVKEKVVKIEVNGVKRKVFFLIAFNWRKKLGSAYNCIVTGFQKFMKLLLDVFYLV